MRDKISEARVKLLHPKVRDEVKRLIEAAEARFPTTVAIRVVQGLRTVEEQNKLYAIGRTVKGENPSKKNPMGSIVTKARGGSSYHNYGLAIDFAILYDTDGNGSYETLSWDIVRDFDKDNVKDWMEIVQVFTDAGWEWGGKWSTINDNPHLQKTFGQSVKQLLAKYNKKELIAGSTYVAL